MTVPFAIGALALIAAVLLARVSAALMRANEKNLVMIPAVACVTAVLLSGACIAYGYHIYEIARRTPTVGAILGAALFGGVYSTCALWACVYNYQCVRRYSAALHQAS